MLSSLQEAGKEPSMETWFSFPMEDSPFPSMQDDIHGHDMAIRTHCPPRLDQEGEGEGEGEGGEWDYSLLLDIEAWPSLQSPPCTETTNEEFSFVDVFINSSIPEVANGADDAVGFTEVATIPSISRELGEIDRGLQLVQLLLACAEAVGCRNIHLAASTLDQIWALAIPTGDSLQRVSYCFAIGLRSRLSLLLNIGMNGSLTSGPASAADRRPLVTREEKAEGFHLLYQSTPYIAFGFLAANEAICRAAQGKDSLHIVDLGMEHTLQWPSLIRTLASRPEGPPRLRITGVVGEDDGSNITELESSMKLLINEASNLGVLVEFRPLAVAASPAVLRAENLDLRAGEALFVNSIMQLHKYVKESRGSLKAILVAIKKLRPALITVVEQDANHNGPFFLGRFIESLHYYSSVFDSLEAGLPRPSTQRMKIEGCHFAEEIRSIVAYEGCDRVERHERAHQWRRQLGRAGFQVVGLRSMSQARMLVSVYGCEGYTLAGEKGCLILGWKGRPILWASAWQVHPAPSS